MRIKRISGAFFISIALLILGVLFIGNRIHIEEQTTHKDMVGLEVFDASEQPKAKLSGSVYKQVRSPAARGISTYNRAASKQQITQLNPPNGTAYQDVFHKNHGTNPFIDTEDDHFSTFAMDVDTASYSVMRRYLRDGNLPPAAAVRVEEYINAFDYNYTPPSDDAFAVHLEGAPSKFGEGKRLQLLRIGIQGRVISDDDRKDAILTFVVDISGSMSMENRLGLVKRALTLLVDQLRPTDKVGIVVYGSNARVVLPHTSIENREYIIQAINNLHTDGATNAEEGLRVGYKLALKNSKSNCINRVILCSDGVANVGRTGPEAILKEISTYVKEGITLTTIGFGMGNYNDVLMEQLANKGNGSYAYVDTIKEAKRIFIENLTGTLQVIAKDAKIQVEFNPETVSRFRLLGYENRSLAHEDFRKDDVDAGEVGSGHSVTALYEIKLHENADGKLATVFIRQEDPDTTRVSEINETFSTNQLKQSYEDTSPAYQLVTAIAEFAEILHESFWAKQGSLAAVQQTIESVLPNIDSKTPQHKERIEELLKLVKETRSLKEQIDG
ncbi:DUF3520 domain-containing protein [Candidatus Poribacteria bacterium]|nr:DUF3520 domain-containing protein [Candidatus Poribacteria bacterium]